MSQENIFNSQTSDNNVQGVANTQTSQQDNSFTDLLSNIKNEKGDVKYRDLPTALDALKHSQEYIPQLKNENETLKQEVQRLRDEANKLRTVEETLERLSSGQQAQSQAANVVDEKSIAELVTKTLSAREQEQIKKQNVQTVVNAMQKSLGDNAEKVFYSKAAELGMSAEQVNALAAQTPQAVLKLFGMEGNTQQTKNVSVTNTSLNTSTFQQQADTFIKKNDKPMSVGYSSQELTNEMRSATKLVEELHSKGLTTYDLSNPKEYFKYFSN